MGHSLLRTRTRAIRGQTRLHQQDSRHDEDTDQVHDSPGKEGHSADRQRNQEGKYLKTGLHEHELSLELESTERVPAGTCS